MIKRFLIKKMSGKREVFDEAKVRRSLLHSGLQAAQQDQLITNIYKKQPKSTLELHNYISRFLHMNAPAVAARYNLKRALIQLGPAGFPFERFIALLLEQMGFSTELNSIMQGICIEHEVDIRANKKENHTIVECKFHSKLGIASDVKVPLYVKARFDDIAAFSQKKEKSTTSGHDLLIVTNTRFTTQATAYATCVGIRLLAWNYPQVHSLPQLIDTYDIHPVTCLTNLKNYHKRVLISHGIVTCKQLLKTKNVLKKVQLPEIEQKLILKQAKEVCALGKAKLANK